VEPRTVFRPDEEAASAAVCEPDPAAVAQHPQSRLDEIAAAVHFTVGKGRGLRKGEDVKWARAQLRSISNAVAHTIGSGRTGWRAGDTTDWLREALWRCVLDAKRGLDAGRNLKDITEDTGLGSEYVHAISAGEPLRGVVELALAELWGVDPETARQFGRRQRRRRRVRR
jgi:hypothetical protein